MDSINRDSRSKDMLATMHFPPSDPIPSPIWEFATASEDCIFNRVIDGFDNVAGEKTASLTIQLRALKMWPGGER